MQWVSLKADEQTEKISPFRLNGDSHGYRYSGFAVNNYSFNPKCLGHENLHLCNVRACRCTEHKLDRNGSEMNKIPFYKMSGSGNDFIIVDNRKKIVDESNLPAFIEKICRRRISVGADGFIMIENSDEADFMWHFYNSDGGRAEMCGNGARCAARFAFIRGIAGSEMTFLTDAGVLQAQVRSDNRVKIRMTEATDLNVDYTLELEKSPLSVSSVNTGVPHVVVSVEKIEEIDVVKMGREIRYHKRFSPQGTNANFVASQEDGTVAIRTYERGVEDETLACGTGAVAGALVMAAKFNTQSPVKLQVRSGGYLTIYFQREEDRFFDLYLEGDARIVYQGELWEDAWC